MSVVKVENGSETVRSVNRCLDIIEFLVDNGKEASVTEISEGIGVSASTVYRQLVTLKARGYVYQNSVDSKYWLGLKFYSIGSMVKQNMPLLNFLGPHADRIAEKYKLTVFVAVPDYSSDICAQQAIIYKKSFSPVILRNEANVGQVMMSHGAATGKCMMSYYPKALLDRYAQYPLAKLTDKTITSWDAMMAEFETIRSLGYALDSEEEAEGKTCVAVPLVDSSGDVIASISLSGPTRSLFQYPINEIVGDLNKAAEAVTKEL